MCGTYWEIEMDWITGQPWERYAAVFGVIVVGCSSLLLTVSKLTKNTWDDELAAWWAKWPMKLVRAFSIFQPKSK